MRNGVFWAWMISAVIAAGTEPPPDSQVLVNQLVDYGKGQAPAAATNAQAQLLAMGTNAFAILIKYVSDNRVACQCFGGDRIGPPRVGQACLDIISMQVERYSYWKGVPSFLTKDNVSSWWERNRGKPMREMQIEALEWTVGQLTTNSQSCFLPPEFIPELRKRMVDQLSRLRQAR